MITRLLIANRGEIACRIIRTAQRLGIHTIAVYSAADASALHVKLADEAHFIGEPAPQKSYLDIAKIIAVAQASQADAIHPGYGFLSENAAFANACLAHELVFVGPDEYALQAMGSKSAAKAIMQQANVPLVPGYHGDVQTPELLAQQAQVIGYPVLLKASAGGGGKGMRVVHHEDEFSAALHAAKRESLANFADDHMLIEKYISEPRHIEVQVFCDRLGNGVYLFDRDCSVQRRHQKIVEEAPAPGLSDELRQAMGTAAVAAAQAIDYVGAGTVEFLLDNDHTFYFMEMNTRLQVEHPVTEMVTGEDLVHWQLIVANGAALPKTQTQLRCTGHAFETRIYAEDPDHDFLPSTGTLHAFVTPDSSEYVRVDSGVLQGDEISVYYDPMFAKLITWGTDRKTALYRCQLALQQFFVVGCTTNIQYLQAILQHPAFIASEVSTHFIEQYQSSLLNHHAIIDAHVLLAAATIIDTNSTQHANRVNDQSVIPANWRANLARHSQITLSQETSTQQTLTIDPSQVWIIECEPAQHVYTVQVQQQQIRLYAMCEKPNQWVITYHGAQYRLLHVQPDCGTEDEQGSTQFVAPMNGTVVSVPITPPCSVDEGDVLMIIEAMKMEHNLVAPCAGSVNEVYFAQGSLVAGGACVLDFVKADD